MTTVAVIPARFGASRFPGKPLARETGKYLIEHVYEGVQQARAIDRVLVATDDQRIAEAVKGFGGEACMTRDDHVSGTDRVGEAAATLSLAPDDLVLNVQGDEPEVNGAALDQLVNSMQRSRGDCRIGTIAAPFAEDSPCTGVGSPLDPNRVKVVVDDRGQALYFSRSLIPYPRNSGGRIERPADWLLHLGVYAFRADTLQKITGPAAPSLAEIESLEQLRWLAQGLPIQVTIVQHRFFGVDTPEDYAAFVRRERQRRGAQPVGQGSP